MWTSSEVRGSAAFLRRDILQEEDLPISLDTVPFFRTANWKETRSHAFTESQHVNLQELETDSDDLGCFLAIYNTRATR